MHLRFSRAAALVAACLALVPAVASADVVYNADWTAYIIRNGVAAPTITPNRAGYSTPNVEFLITQGGQKAALGTDKLNGTTIGNISQLSITRLDDYAAYAANTGAHYAPYMNFWVKDSTGKVAVLANEPSNAEWTGTSEWNTTGANLLTKTVKVFEMESGFQLPVGVVVQPNGLTNALFGAFSSYTIDAPSTAYLTANEPAGSGAPRELDSFKGYGFNWVFGDTLSNYTAGDPGYVVGNPQALAVVPIPLAAPAGLALLGVVALKRRLGARAND